MWNTACGGAENTAQLVIFRFLAGLGGSAPFSVRTSRIRAFKENSLRSLQIGGGVLGDLWRNEERGQAIALYSLAPLLGPYVNSL